MLLLENESINVYSDNMRANDNSVNIKESGRGYHHGDLRDAAIAEGLRLLEGQAADSLSLREIARNVGVSATALYRHFPDKASLVTALASAGFDQLGREQNTASLVGGGEGFAAIGQAYVRFALANPALFRLMFAKMAAQAHPDQESPEGTAADLLRQGIVRVMPAGTSRNRQFAAMLRAWSLVHGLSMLILDQQVDREVAQAMIADVISADSLNFG